MTNRTAFDDFPDDPEPVSAKTARGAAKWLDALRAKGVAPPVDERHAAMFDPPLTVAEQRHGSHERQETPVAGCRFCDEARGRA